MSARNIQRLAAKQVLKDVNAISSAYINFPEAMDADLVFDSGELPDADSFSAYSVDEMDIYYDDEEVFYDDLDSFATIDLCVLDEDTTRRPSHETEHMSDSLGSSLATDLLLFFIMFNITESAMKYLLKTLLNHNIDVPQSVYLL